MMDNLVLFYDSETTGLPDWRRPSDSPRQPRLVQLAALLVNPATQQTIQSMDVIVRPDGGWEIPQEVVDVHGITTEYAQDVGVTERVALALFLDLWRGRMRVGHSEQFDARIIRIATKRYCDEAVIDAWKEGPAQCTGRLAAKIMVEDERGKFGRRIPRLTAAYQHFVGGELLGAHSAMGDVRACMAVWNAIQAQAHENVPA